MRTTVQYGHLDLTTLPPSLSLLHPPFLPLPLSLSLSPSLSLPSLPPPSVPPSLPPFLPPPHLTKTGQWPQLHMANQWICTGSGMCPNGRPRPGRHVPPTPQSRRRLGLPLASSYSLWREPLHQSCNRKDSRNPRTPNHIKRHAI